MHTRHDSVVGKMDVALPVWKPPIIFVWSSSESLLGRAYIWIRYLEKSQLDTYQIWYGTKTWKIAFRIVLGEKVLCKIAITAVLSQTVKFLIGMKSTV